MNAERNDGKTGGGSCPCEVTDCPRHGDCAECQDFHRKLGDLTACEKTEASKGAIATPPPAPAVEDFRLTNYASCAG